MRNDLKDSFWYNTGEGRWRLLSSGGEETLAVVYRDSAGLWRGRVPPRQRDHLLPKKSLHEIMRQAEVFVRKRDEVCL